MKFAKKLTALAVSSLMMFSMAGITASAAAVTQDGLNVSLTTDKTEYKKDEAITATLTVENTGGTSVKDVKLENIVPEGYELAKDYSLTKSVDELKSNDKAELKVVYNAKTGGNVTPSNNNTTTTNSTASTTASGASVDTVKTSDSTNAVVFAVILLISIGVGIMCLKNKKGKEFLSIVLCVSVLGTIIAVVPFEANAAESDNKAINVSETVNIDNKSTDLKALVKYALPNSGEPSLYNFKSDEEYFVCGQETKILFTVDAVNVTDKIELIKNEKDFVGYMHDDGRDGDMTANDGKYTIIFKETINSSETISVLYSAKSSDCSSNTINLYFFAPLTENTAIIAKENYQLVFEKVSEIEAKYKTGGSIKETDKHKVVSEVKDLLNNLIDSKIVLFFEEANGNFDIKLTSGLAIAYSVETDINKKTDSIGADTSATVLTFQPCYTSMGGQNYSTTAYTLPEGVNFVLEMLDDVATDINDTFSNYSFSSATNYNDDQVTLNTIRSLHENEIVLWHGHGYYGPMVKSCLVTGEDFDWNGWQWDLTGYFADCVTNRIANSWITGYDKVIISSKYIEKYCGKLNNSLIYLAACNSGKTSELSNSFLNKGSTAVVANSDTIVREYNVAMLYETLRNMSLINPNTQNYYTLQESMNAAKNVYGLDDSDARYGGIGATPNIFGGTDANDYRLYDNRIYVSGKVTDEDNNTLDGVNVSIHSNDNKVNLNQSTDDGEYSFELHKDSDKTYTLKFEKEGYEAKTETLSNVDGDRTINVVLKAKDGIISGKVFTENSEPIQNAKITANNKEVYTNANGEFSISLPKGNYYFEVTCDGYQPAKIANINVQPGKTTKLNNIVLKIDSQKYRDDFISALLANEDQWFKDYGFTVGYSSMIEFKDLDFDGVPELIMQLGGGSMRNCDAYAYSLHDGKLVKSKMFQNVLNYYQDTKTNKKKIVGTHTWRNGVYEMDWNEFEFTYDGKDVATNYFLGEHMQSDSNGTPSYQYYTLEGSLYDYDSSQNTMKKVSDISQDQYDKIKIAKSDGLEPLYVKTDSIPASDYKSYTNSKKKEALEKAYDSFGYYLRSDEVQYYNGQHYYTPINRDNLTKLNNDFSTAKPDYIPITTLNEMFNSDAYGTQKRLSIDNFIIVDDKIYFTCWYYKDGPATADKLYVCNMDGTNVKLICDSTAHDFIYFDGKIYYQTVSEMGAGGWYRAGTNDKTYSYDTKTQTTKVSDEYFNFNYQHKTLSFNDYYKFNLYNSNDHYYYDGMMYTIYASSVTVQNYNHYTKAINEHGDEFTVSRWYSMQGG